LRQAIPLVAVDLAQPPLDLVALHRIADLAGNRQAEPSPAHARGDCDADEMSRGDPLPPRLGAKEIAPLEDSLLLGESPAARARWHRRRVTSSARRRRAGGGPLPDAASARRGRPWSTSSCEIRRSGSGESSSAGTCASRLNLESHLPGPLYRPAGEAADQSHRPRPCQALVRISAPRSRSDRSKHMTSHVWSAD